MKNVYWIICCIPFSLLILVSCEHDVINPDLVEKYRHIRVIDIHNHDASAKKYRKSMKIWDAYGIDKIVLFGDAAEPSAMETDEIAWEAYEKYPDRIYPFFSGINIHDQQCTAYAVAKFEKGYFGAGEIIAASANSPVVSGLPWKGDHPMDDYLPDIYALCGEYGAPILLHIDPPYGTVITRLKEALDSFPNTNFIFAHANAFNPAHNIRSLLIEHDNLYIDFFAGFTRYNPGSNNTLEDFVPLINEYPGKFMVSTDSGFDVGYDNAYSAIYELFELLDPEVIEQIAHLNFEKLIENLN